ncbi:MAG: glycosyltransferase, partial [Syntrophales bacterium]|nr:glycosyltransferase [Syntrophales bacterium]
MTADCLKAIAENTTDYEIVLVDNGSSPSGLPVDCMAHQLIRNETNLGFPKAVNQGIRAAKGDIICLLNNDVICTPQWADRLLYHLNVFDIVAPMANYCAGLQQEVALETYNNEQELYAAAGKWGEDHN